MNKARNLNRNEILRKELVTLVVPRSGKLTNPSNPQLQVAYLDTAIEKICYPSMLLDEGWTRLPSLTAILDQVTGQKSFQMEEYYLDSSANPGKKDRVTETVIHSGSPIKIIL